MASGTTSPPATADRLFQEALVALNLGQAPLAPVALAFTLGILADRLFIVPLGWALLLAVGGLAAWVAALAGGKINLGLLYLWAGVAALGAGYHHVYLRVYADDDIGHLATTDARPVWLRGTLENEPNITRRKRDDPLRSFAAADSTSAILRVAEVKTGTGWIPISGRAQLYVSEPLQGFHVGDEVEVVGRLQAPAGPANPGEMDYAGYLRDQRIRAQVSVVKTTQAVTPLRQSWSFQGVLAQIRGWGERVLDDYLPESTSGLAAALLLGDTSAMAREDWDKYLRTGVIHVLAISGQHLVVLSVFLWLALRVLGVGRRPGSAFVAGFLLGYSLLTGGRPPVMRSAVTMLALCGAVFLRRRTSSANTLALAWIVVAVLNPTDVFNTGCQLSFLCVAILYAAEPLWARPEPDALQELIDQSRPWWRKLLAEGGRQIWEAYLVTLVIGLAVMPLSAARFHTIAPVGLLIGPPVVLLTSIALVTGFLLLLTSWCWPLAALLAGITHLCLAGCEGLVGLGMRLPGAYWFVPDLPEWWLWAFYVGLLAVLAIPALRQRRTLVAGLGWLCLGLALPFLRATPNELRCIFVAVGHGGCTVLQTPDGRTLLYDAGAIQGPNVTRRNIVPFLWSQGITRIDEVFLSHADLDHYNGLPSLCDYFAVGQVSCTPTFTARDNPPVRHTLDTLRQRRIPVRVLKAGDRITAGPVGMEVLHPPAAGPAGNENARSLVLRVRHAGHTILLTGDLEDAGLTQVLGMPAAAVEVLMAPHHGSKKSNIPALAEWAKPKVVVSSQGLPKSLYEEPYTKRGATFLGTWPHGAVTIVSRRGELSVTTYRTGQRLVVTPHKRK
jgi:competence protein ComEC